MSADIDALRQAKQAAQARLEAAQQEAAAIRRRLTEAQRRIRALERERDAAREAWLQAVEEARKPSR
jgi:predicted  nucleic acid-binding Zn-ribbon protein